MNGHAQPPHRPPAWSSRLLRAHLVLAHASLLLALLWTAGRPAGLLGSVLHPEVLACVHLVTLGSLATSCFGAFHAVLPLAMGTHLPSTWRDWLLLVAVQLTASGVAAHMALGTYGGVSWSALLLLAALALQLPRYVRATRTAKAPWPLRVGVLCAWGNLALAIVLGGTLALQHSHPLLPHDPLHAVFAHAHLALGGFAGTLVAAVGIRLLPMFLPALPVPNALAGGTVLLLGGGGLTAGLGVLVPACLDVGLWLLFGGGVAWLATAAVLLLRRRPPPPPNTPRLLPAHALVGGALASFAAAVALGGALHAHWLDATWWPVYGALLLVGGFGSLVLGIGQRLLSLAARLHAGPASGLPAHTMPSNQLAWCTASLWLLGLAQLPFALRAGSPGALRLACALLAIATAADLANLGIRRRG